MNKQHNTGWLPLVYLSLAIFFPSCRQETETSVLPDPAGLEEAFALSNIYLLELEEEAIDDFLVRYGWEMKASGSGLRYMIMDAGQGPKASYGQRVTMDYDVYLITGDPVYSSADDGPMRFTVGRGGVERGLEEGILLLAKGGRARFILPHHLAHGVPGDGQRIPRRATIIYEVEVLEIQ